MVQDMDHYSFNVSTLIMGIVKHIFICLNIICIFFLCTLWSSLCLGPLSFDMQFKEMEAEIQQHPAYLATHTAQGALLLIHLLGASFFTVHKDIALTSLSLVLQVFFHILQKFSILFSSSSLWYKYIFSQIVICIFHYLWHFSIRIIFVVSSISIFSIVGSEFVTPRKLSYSSYFKKLLSVFF